ncbi:MAG: TIGR00270 family protein [Thermoplasmatales archaeon]|jgi:putative transcription factor|nr:TIGR00270 family protein [Thermoplasmatales archaeon]
MSMLCEMCGKEVPFTKAVIVEGTKLNVCQNCARFGDDFRSGSGTGAPMGASVVEERLQRRERRMQTKDVYAGTASVEMVEDYGRIVREARERKGLEQEEFANSISEKKGIIAKVETNSLIPDDKLVRKLEKALDVKLRETVQAGAVTGSSGSGAGMTLSHFIKKE